MSNTKTPPRYIQLSNNIRAQIKEGQWQVGDRLPSFAEMYHEHGASTATMQKVYDVLEKEGFVERRSRSGIYVTHPVQAQTGVLAYVVPKRTGIQRYGASLYSMRLLHGIHEAAATCGYQLTLCSYDQLQASPHPVDGCIVQGEIDSIEACARFGKPVVSLISHLTGIPAVGTDETAGFYAITHYLLQQGHRRIAAMIGSDALFSENDAISPLRRKGYIAALKNLDINPPKSWLRKIHQYGAERGYANWGYLEMRQWLRDGWADLGCTAIVTQNDLMAIGVTKALRQHGYRVPQDISVTGYDDSGEDAHFDLKLTTVHVPLEAIAQKAVHLLDQLLAHRMKNAAKIDLPTHLVIGDSTTKWEGGNG